MCRSRKLEEHALEGGEARLGFFQRAVGSVHAHDFLERFFFQEIAQQTTFSATEIEHAFRAGTSEGREDRAESLVIQTDLLFDLRFFFAVLLFGHVGIGIALVGQTAQRGVHQIAKRWARAGFMRRRWPRSVAGRWVVVRVSSTSGWRR